MRLTASAVSESNSSHIVCHGDFERRGKCRAIHLAVDVAAASFHASAVLLGMLVVLRGAMGVQLSGAVGEALLLRQLRVSGSGEVMPG